MVDYEVNFTARLWVYPGKAAWYFVTLPKKQAKQIRFFQPKRIGFGSVKVQVTIGETTWKTSLFPDKKSGSYHLPIKAAIRKQEKLQPDDRLQMSLLLNC